MAGRKRSTPCERGSPVSHVLVSFVEEDGQPTSIVPVNRIQEQSLLRKGELCTVIWTDKHVYPARILAIGTMTEMKAAEKQDEDGAGVSICKQKTKVRRKRERSHGDSTEGRKGGQERKGKTLDSTKKRAKKSNKDESLVIEVSSPASVSSSCQKSECHEKGESLRSHSSTHASVNISTKDALESTLSSEHMCVDASLKHAPEDVIQTSAPSSQSDPPEGMLDKEHLLVLEVRATSDLCRQLLLRQEQLQEFFTQELGQMHMKLNDILTMLPSQHSVIPIPDTAPIPNIHAHTPPPLEEDVLDKTFNLPLSSTPVSSTARPHLEQGSADQFGVPMSRLLALRSSSCSRENFSSNLNKELFTMDERMQSNVKGVLQKKKLDINRVLYIRHQTFEFFPLTAAENKERCWALCIRAIDSCN